MRTLFLLAMVTVAACSQQGLTDAGVDAGPDAGHLSACLDLDAGACAARPECEVLICPDACTCGYGSHFEGCIGDGFSFGCPHYDCAGGDACNDLDAGSCGAGRACVPQLDSSSVGFDCCACNNPCTSDSACDAGFVCGPNKCGCGTVCMPNCTTAGCLLGQTCGADGRCIQPTCGTSADCRALEDCDAGTCVRRPCSSAACVGGFCVNGLCWADDGMCLLQN